MRLTWGEVITIVTITAAIAQRVVRRSGKRMVGLNWLMLSSPENASHAEAKPDQQLIRMRCFGDAEPGDDGLPRYWLRTVPCAKMPRP